MPWGNAHTMTTTHRLLIAGSAALAGFALYSNAAGPLTPPAPPGDSAAEMPSLTELHRAAYQGRTPLVGSTGTLTISQPGSYVLTGNITVGQVDGISITANDVTLDLNGFTISTTSNAFAAHRGIFVQGNNVVIRNGRIKGNYVNIGGELTGGGFSTGVEGDFNSSSAGTNVVCEDLQVIGCDHGIHFYWQEGNYTVRRCNIHHTGSAISLAGIPAGVQNTVSECQVVQCSGTGITAGLVKDCYVMINTTLPSPPDAIYASLAIGCRVSSGNVNVGNRYNMP